MILWIGYDETRSTCIFWNNPVKWKKPNKPNLKGFLFLVCCYSPIWSREFPVKNAMGSVQAMVRLSDNLGMVICLNFASFPFQCLGARGLEAQTGWSFVWQINCKSLTRNEQRQYSQTFYTSVQKVSRVSQNDYSTFFFEWSVTHCWLSPYHVTEFPALKPTAQGPAARNHSSQ